MDILIRRVGFVREQERADFLTEARGTRRGTFRFPEARAP